MDIEKTIKEIFNSLFFKIKLKIIKGFCELLAKVFNTKYLIETLNNKIYIYFKNNRKLYEYCKKNKLDFIYFLSRKHFYNYYNKLKFCNSIYFTNYIRR